MEHRSGSHVFQRARHIVRNPNSSRTVKRYKGAVKLYHDALLAAEIDPDVIDPNEERTDEKCPSGIALALIYARCGPPNEGCEGLSALATGGAIRSAVVSYWRSKGVNGDYVNKGGGKYSGNPGKNPDLSVLIKTLARRQKECGSNIVKRAYQETHEDVRTLMESYVEPFVNQALAADINFNILEFECSIINCMQFSSVSRADEMLRLDIESLRFTGCTIDSPVVATLEYTKNNLSSKTDFMFTRGLHITMCGLSALLRWLCVLRSFGITSGPLFPKVVSNRLQARERLEHETYRRTLKSICSRSGISDNVGEHSARRGGAGYYYFVLRWDIVAIYRCFKWDSFHHMLIYIGVEDRANSYALAGFTALGTNELRFGA